MSTVRNPPCEGLVLDSFSHGALVAKVVKKKIGAMSYLEFAKPVDGSFVYDLFCIDDPEDWLVLPVTARAPAWMEQHFGVDASSLSGVVATLPVGDAINLVLCAANNGFRQLTVPQMQMLVTMWKVPFKGKRPTLEAEVAHLLVQHVFPKYPEEDIAEIVAQRRLRSKKEDDTVFTDDVVQMTKDACGSDDEDFAKLLDEDFFLTGNRDSKAVIPSSPFFFNL